MADTRPIDEPIPDDEPLYRAIGPGDVQGERVAASAIDLEGTSVHRAKYCDAHVPLLANRPDLDGIAATTPGALPGSVVIHDTDYRFFAVDAPSPGDDHHAEIRVNTDRDSRENKRKIKSKSAKLALRETLARTFRIHTPPGGPS
ncbi:MAG: hypothetical protein H6737_18065 [Alphaproteobacteria bacterium]|nr:hypothetical protein [Alphaproteobacteria bacterium]